MSTTDIALNFLKFCFAYALCLFNIRIFCCVSDDMIIIFFFICLKVQNKYFGTKYEHVTTITTIDHYHHNHSDNI